MSLILINSQSNQQIPLDKENPLIIGRSNVLGCFDKKVSRSHGKITCTENGEVNLLALHHNPCFFMKKGVPPIRQLNKDEEETLTKGDCLGLLPNSFWFQISSSNVDIKEKPEEASTQSCKDSKTANLENVRESKVNNDESENVKDSRTGSLDYSNRIGSPEFEKTRRLPLSAYDTDEVKMLTKNDKCSRPRDHDTSIKKLKLNDTDCNRLQFDTKNNNIKQGDNTEGEEPSSSNINIDEKSDNGNQAKEVTDIEKDKETELDKPIKRILCMYEHNCFRKNPQHKIEFCHPGDSDYVIYEKRPKCQYGIRCCKKNKSHRVSFRHVRATSRNSSSASPTASSPLPPKRRRKQVKRSSDYEDDIDDDEGGDESEPFGNDASSDEYAPSDSNSEG